MGEAAFSYWLDEFINQDLVAADANVLSDYVVLADGETDEDWKYGTD